MEKLKQYKYIIVLVLVLLGFLFYWYEWRPTQARKECYELMQESKKQDWALDPETDRDAWYEGVYKRCLMEKGL